MLSSKKSFLAQEKIEFLGMIFHNGFYQPGPHIAKDLLDFPDENLTPKQIQQFLGIINYLRNFIPHVAKYTSLLSKLLKKNPPPWTAEQTTAVKHLKKVAQNPPPLRIPSDGHRILQTDASDNYWGAILLEEVKGERHYCGHASGQFKDSEKHYHATYKEILAVKRGIDKFNFHLATYEFTVEMDNTSFPSMLDVKRKTLPDSQLLRWKDWFSRYKFSVKHIKGKHNTLADLLSRPSKILLTPNKPLPICMVQTIALPNPPPFDTMIQKVRALTFPPGTTFNDPTEAKNYARHILFYWLHLLLVHTDIHPQPQYFDLDTPFLTIPIIRGPIPDELLWYLWSLSALFTCAIIFPVFPIYHYLCDSRHQNSNLVTLFKMFASLPYWRGTLYRIINENNVWEAGHQKQQKFYCCFTLNREYRTENNMLITKNEIECWKLSPLWPTHENSLLREVSSHLILSNEPFPDEDDLQILSTPLGPFPSEEFHAPYSFDQTSHPGLQEFQANFLTQGIRYFPPNTSSASSSHITTPPDADDPYGGPFAQDPYSIWTQPNDNSDSSEDPNMDNDHEPICRLNKD